MKVALYNYIVKLVMLVVSYQIPINKTIDLLMVFVSISSSDSHSIISASLCSSLNLLFTGFLSKGFFPLLSAFLPFGLKKATEEYY